MTKEAAKKNAALAALDYIEQDMIVGVGTGSTVAYFIEALSKVKQKIDAAVASSVDTANKLKALGIPLIDLNAVPELPLYVDGADEVNSRSQLIKGGGGALTREKIIATVASTFVCIADDEKLVDTLGEFPVPVEVIPMARSYVARRIVQLEGDPVYREGFVTDNGNIILDVYNLRLFDAKKIEDQLKSIVGVVESGIFAHRTANVVLLGNHASVDQLNA